MSEEVGRDINHKILLNRVLAFKLVPKQEFGTRDRKYNKIMTDENYMTPLVEILREIREKGYICDFELTDGRLFCKQCKEAFRAEDLIIERVYRFEGDSSPDDMAVLYGVKAGNGMKGVLIDAYGTYDNEELREFLKNVKVEEIRD